MSADHEWISRCEDLEQSVLKYKSVRFSRFVSPHELAVFQENFRVSPFINVLAFGGAEDAERVMLGFFPEFIEPDEALFPITRLFISGISGMTHRDVLGSVLGLGIKREMTGDIYVNGDEAVLMCDESIADFLMYQLKTVGRKKVTVSHLPEEKSLSLAHPFEVSRVVVSSLRLDALVSACTRISRGESQALIAADGVNVNFCTVNDGAKKIKEGDVLSIKHHGRYVFLSVTGETKKGRIAVEIKKYI